MEVLVGMSSTGRYTGKQYECRVGIRYNRIYTGMKYGSMDRSEVQ